MAKPTPRPDDPTQSKGFMELATEIGKTEDFERSLRDFERAVRKVTTARREAPEPKNGTAR